MRHGGDVATKMVVHLPASGTVAAMYPCTRPGTRHAHAFTLVELLVVVIIAGALASIAIVNLVGTQRLAYDSAAATDLRHMRTAADTAADTGGVFPVTVAELETNGFSPSPDVSHAICTTDTADGPAYVIAAQHDSSSTVHWNVTPLGTLQDGEELPPGLPCYPTL